MNEPVNKPKLKADHTLYLLNGDDTVLGLFEEIEVKQKLTGNEVLHRALLFVKTRIELDKLLPDILTRLPEDALLWIAYPKRSSGISSGLIRDEGREIVNDSNRKAVTNVPVNEVRSAIRFKHKSQIRTMKRTMPLEERKTESIDYINRTVQLSKDVIAAMKPYKGLETFFNSLSFTHKKEYAEAKKSETYTRQVEKIIETVLKLKAQKEQKNK